MGRPKLLLPLGTGTVISRLLDVLDRVEIAERFVVVHPDDERLQAAVTTAGATVVRPETRPPHMRDSVECALAEIRRRHNPAAEDGWLLTPADHPMLETGVLDVLLGHWLQNDCHILVPTCDGRRGHPTLFRWELAEEVARIPPDRGLNWLLAKHETDVVEWAVNNPAVITDLDTPEEYYALLKRWRDG